MSSNHSPRQDAPPELLAVSFSYPPLAYPRSSQVARLLKHLRLNTTLVCADEEGARRDPTMEPDAEARLNACLRVPFGVRGWRAQANRVASRLRLPLWNRMPDQYASWGTGALKAVKDFVAGSRYEPDVVASFGQPMSDHLIGMKLKRLFRAPWAAHFSDPWVDNPFNNYDALSRRINLSLERKVMETADRLIFTSDETVELMMGPYPAGWRAKARVLPHSFDPALYPARDREGGDRLVARYMGEFYGKRTPKPLVESLRSILQASPQSLERIRFELVGPITKEALDESALETLPEGLVTVKPPVNYKESLQLAANADGLLIVDAPARKSVFLPSKLIDYIGAGRPILGLTPPGTAADLIKRLGGWVADPTDAEAMRRATEAFISYLYENADGRQQPWGEPSVRGVFEAQKVADSFEAMLRELVG